MFSISVRDHVMCSHSLRGEVFGPAQNRHGATYAVTAEFRGPALDEHNVLLDLGWAQRTLGDALAPLRYADLDAVFPGQNTTTEFLCRFVHGELASRLPTGFRGVIRVELVENPQMAAAYEAPASASVETPPDSVETPPDSVETPSASVETPPASEAPPPDSEEPPPTSEAPAHAHEAPAHASVEPPRADP